MRHVQIRYQDMISDDAKSFRAQLLAIRPQVEEAEKERELNEQEEKDRTRDKLAEELKKIPPDQFFRHLRELEGHYKAANKNFCPMEAIRGCLSQLDEFKEKVDRYQYYRGRFADIFTDSMQRSLDEAGRTMSALRETIDSQWQQWQEVSELVNKVNFRLRTKKDDTDLIEVAKTFHQRAHGIQLDVPKNYYGGKGDQFFVAEVEDKCVGHFEFYPSENRIAFAIITLKGINFIKLVRALVENFCREGPVPSPLDTVNIRLYDRQEVKFYTDLGFMRAETLGMSDWLYQRKL